MMNIAKHLSYIETSVAFLRHQVKKQPQCLELGQGENANVPRLMGDMDECLVNTKMVFDEIRFFKRDLALLKDNAEHALANEIGPTELMELTDEEERKRPYIQSVTFAAVATAGCFYAVKFHRGIFSNVLNRLGY